MVMVTSLGFRQDEIPSALSDIPGRKRHNVAAERQALVQERPVQLGTTSPSWLRLGPQTRVSPQQAYEAFGRTFHGADRDSQWQRDKTPLTGMPSAREFEKMSVELMMVAVTLMAGELIGHITGAKAKAIKILGDKQDSLRAQELKEFREQIEKALEDQKKAKKAGIFGVIFDWVVAAVQVVTGVAKIVGGALTGNAMTAAGGAMDLLAGLAGVVKAAMNTMALIDPANADKYRKVANEAAKVQLVFEIAGAAIDFLSAARNLITTKAISQATKTALKDGAGQALSEAIKTGSKTAVAEIAEKVGRQVADQVSENLIRNLGSTAMQISAAAGKKLANNIVQQVGVNQMLSKFSHEAIEKLVGDVIKRVANDAIDKALGWSIEPLTKAIVKEVSQRVAHATLKASTYIGINATREAANGMQKVTLGALNMERAQLQKEIDQLVLDQQWVMMLLQMFDQYKKQQVEEIKRLTEGQAEALSGASDTLSDAAQTRVRGATSMAGVAAYVA